MSLLIPALLFTALPGALGLDVPANVRQFYNDVKAKGKCDNKLSSGFYNDEFGGPDMSYCGDHMADSGIIYLAGPSTGTKSSGMFSNMDVDCDGTQAPINGDTRCGDTPQTQSRTSARLTVAGYNAGISDLNPHIHPYVVFGNSGENGKGFPTFEPSEYGMEMASVMAVVCGDKMFYGVWGDENADNGPRPSVGEVSLSLATACYGQKMSGRDEDGSSHNDYDVLYIGFTGKDAVPGAKGANWAAGSFDEFHSSIKSLGDKLVSKIGSGGSGSTPTTTSAAAPSATATCKWTGHCLGATCSTADDCSDDLTCMNSKCAVRN
ncbi:unnamed protein product [Clonostachys rosea f. rosea IK726]|uniref:Endo-chitosanase n=2 Tax=Bionectria ochroleuca TaxID=29856 RepID=A0A0B7KAA6_BIOOC|nr:unnamed protein product [Clonostachys rosea f. rosea IK726]